MRNRSSLIWFIALALVNESVHLIVPIAIGLVIDHGIVNQDFTAALGGVLLIVALRLFANWCWTHFFLRMAKLRAAEQHNLRMSVTAAVLDPNSKPLDRPAGEVLSIATSDADRAPDLFDLLTWAFPAAAVLIGTGIWLLYVNAWIGLTVFIAIALQILVLRYITPILSRMYDAQQSRAADAAATATDLVHGLRVLQGLGVQSRARLMYRNRSRTALNAALSNARFAGLSDGLMTLISTIMLAAVVIISGMFAMNGQLSIGMFIAIVGLMRSFSGMMNGLAGVPVWWAGFSTSARRIRHLLSEMGRSINEEALSAQVASNSVRELSSTEKIEGGSRRLSGLGSITTPILGEVHDGELVGVVPASASDARLALADVSSLKLPVSHMLVEPHAVDLFDGTLREQLATRAPISVLTGELLLSHMPGEESDFPSKDEWALSALESAGAADLLRILPDGLDSRIMDRGANLSGGQRQRIALARALASDAPALVLHDPSTAVDAVTEQTIAEGIARTRKISDRLTIVVAKAPALLAQADRVIFLSDGKVVGEGTHRELMNNALYAEVVQR